mgnify:CR=1 FL=1|jgi:preprotein translocase SecE subunit
MAKKKNKRIVKAPRTEEIKPEVETDVEVVEPDTEAKVETNETTETKNTQKQKKTKVQKGGKQKGNGGLGKKAKETISELKKVSWPNFKTVVKNTGIVIVVVLVFTLVLFGIDRGLAALYNLIPR